MDDRLAAEVAKAIAADSDIRVEFSVPEGMEVRFLGNPILALNPATNNLTVPARFLSHRLIKNRYFFTLPRPLWDEIYNKIVAESDDVDESIVELEYVSAEMCGDHSTYAGLWRGRAFSYNLLRPPARFRPKVPDSWDINQAQLDNEMRVIEGRTESLAKVARAYAGWLMANPKFLDEHDALFAQWAEMVRRWGLARLGIFLPDGMFIPGDDPHSDPQWSAYRAAFDEFYARWRLQGLAAPYLPIPLQPLMAGNFPVSVLPQVTRAGGAFVLPDTFPIPSRDNLRGMLEDALHGASAPDHLADWMAIIASDNAAKKPLITFGRLFEVQHYYRILHHRHARSLRRKLTIVKAILASFLGTRPRTIHEDLLHLNRRLGPQWIKRGNDSPIGPFSDL